MFSVEVEGTAQEQLVAFVNSYKNIFRNLYYDSGVFSEKIIIKNYEEIGDSFVDEIMFFIKKEFSCKLMLGRKSEGNNDYSISFGLRSFTIKLHYTEDTENTTRYIENIIFTKK